MCVHAPVCASASVCSEVVSYLHMQCYAELYEPYGNLFKILMCSVKSTAHNNVIACESSILTLEWVGGENQTHLRLQKFCLGSRISNLAPRIQNTQKLHLN